MSNLNYKISETTGTLTYSSSGFTETTGFTDIDETIYNINVPSSYKYYDPVTSTYKTYSSISIRSNGWLAFSSGVNEVNYGKDPQSPINTLRFFSFDAKSTVKHYFDANNNLMISSKGASFYSYPTRIPFTIVIKITPYGLIQVYYQSVGTHTDLNAYKPIIGYVGSNSSVTTDDIFFSTFNGVQAFNKDNINGKMLNFDFTGLGFLNPLPANSASNLITKGYTAVEMKRMLYTNQQLQDAGYDSTSVTIANSYVSGTNPSTLLDTYTVAQMLTAGMSVAQMYNNGFGLTRAQMLAGGITIAQMYNNGLAGGITVAQMYNNGLAGGITIAQMLAANITLAQMYTGGITIAQMLSENITLAQMLTAGISVAQMLSGGITIAQMLSGGITIAQMFNGGITIAQMFNGGITLSQMYSGGIAATYFRPINVLFYKRDIYGDTWNDGSITIKNKSTGQVVTTLTLTTEGKIWSYDTGILYYGIEYEITKVGGSYPEEILYAITTSSVTSYNGSQTAISTGTGVILAQQTNAFPSLKIMDVSLTSNPLNITATQLKAAGYTQQDITSAGYTQTTTPLITNFSNLSKTLSEGSFTIVAPSSTSPGAFSYTSSDTSVATISGSTVTILKAGATTITALQGETATYYGASISCTLTVISKVASNLSIGSVSVKKFGDISFTLPVTTSSTGSISYTSSVSSVATISSVGLVTIVGAGSTILTVSQLTDANYFAGSETYTLTIEKTTSNLAIGSVSAKKFGDAEFTLPVTTSSTGSISYTSSVPSVATISSVGLVTIVGAGSTVLTVSQLTDANYFADSATYTLTIEKTTSSLLMVSISEKTNGDVPFELVVTTNSTGTISYTSSNTSVATVSSVGLVTIVGAGSTVLTVSQLTDANYLAKNVEKLLTVKESSASNPTVISGGSGLNYFLNTTAKYAVLSGDISVTSGSLQSTNKKVIKGSKRLMIKRS